jgi:hypothetical protein
MSDALNKFLERYRSAIFSHSEEIFEGLDRRTVRLVQVSSDVPCELYADLYESKASSLEELDPCPEPGLRDEWRRIANHMANAPGNEVCHEWSFVSERYSYRVLEISSSEVVAGCEINDLVAQEERLAKIAAIGLTFSSDAIHAIAEVLRDERFEFGAEGTGASGYELCTAKGTATEAIEFLKTSGAMDNYMIELYSRIRGADEGTRYDRLLDHLEGEDPDRPSFSGIQINL